MQIRSVGHPVALLAEGVDRNLPFAPMVVTVLIVALLAEGVDRNTYYDPRLAALGESPSSRRAWIEIISQKTGSGKCLVALLAEGVDRNYADRKTSKEYQRSPSSRRAWIEINTTTTTTTTS